MSTSLSSGWCIVARVSSLLSLGQVRPRQGLALSRVNGSQCDGVGQHTRQVGHVPQDAISVSLQMLNGMALESVAVF